MPEPLPIDENLVEHYRDKLQHTLPRIEARIEAAGGTGVALLPVSKGHPVEAAVAAQRMSIPALGENYAQELEAKAVTLRQLEAPMDWHFIGQLQSNKVRMIAEHVSLWQSVDRVKIGREIAKRASGARVLIQVNLSDESHKGGIEFADLDSVVDALLQIDIDVRGLMGVGVADDDAATARGFGRLRAAVDRLGLAECSMGMTADLEMAIREGSTMVRIGSALFGPRE